ncbi:MAG: adenosylcobinamide amidohydrolase [Methanospirillum sp.]|uniref:adenosylcobinamide amidohydrolase n=1 Tax=Methanospirillum sp. TaxID=45200 RepID=UPI00236C78D6|nr:adenosylcobinamide amidohydrolase [Methanospirillum sp.]MDD1729159.1 adenosylcobinamide amidohydrolase [Methanospirillum sp.]
MSDSIDPHSSELPDNTTENLFITSSGETASRTDDSIIVRLPPGRVVLSTASVNGGFRTDMQAVINHQLSHDAIHSHQLEGGSIESYLAKTAKRLNLDPDTTAGLLTAAKMKHAAVVTESFRGLEVTALITAGIEVNGGRAGDPASYYQESGKITPVGGTINTILIINADLPERTCIQAVITATEAKTAALQQLMAQSQYSSGIATGSGTDGIAIIADTTSSQRLTDAGKHSKLGELIGTAIIKGTTEALSRQSGLNSLSQRNLMVRLARFGITEEEIWSVATKLDGENRRACFINSLREIAQEPALVSAVSAVIHIHDEISWGLIPAVAGQMAACNVLSVIPYLAEIRSKHADSVPLSHQISVLENLKVTIAYIAKQKYLSGTKISCNAQDTS